jgi:hypothetical protein
MRINRLLLISAPIIAFIIAQYAGISAVNILNNHPTKSLDLGNSGLLATNVGSNLYIAWTEFDNKEIALASSTPKKFNIDKITNDYPMPLSRSMDASGSNVFIAWIDDYLHPRKVLLSSNIEGMDTKIIRETNYVLDYPTIVVSGPVVYIAWLEYIDNNYQVLLRYSHDNGNTFSNIIELNKHNAGFPIIEVEGSNVYIAWVERVNNNRNVVLIASNDAGNSFREILRIKDNATLPGLDVDGALVCLSWFGISNNIKLYEACSIDNENFRMHKIAEGKLKMHRISVEGSNVYVTWVEEDKKIKQFNIAASHNAGIDFNEPVNIAVGDINKAGIVASGSNVYALWSELYCVGFNCDKIETNVYVKVSYDAGNSFEESFSLG